MTEVAIAPHNGAALAEQVVIKGDLKALTEQERMSYYSAVCNSLGLNPLTRPFEYISLNGKLTLYATRAAGDQLRAVRGITITNLDPRQIGDLFVVTATGRDRTGREDASTGAVSTAGLRGEALANAMMKAETKAKRRLTLSLAGLGWTDETEVDSIPGAERVEPDEQPKSLAERAAARRAAIVVDPANADAARGGADQEPTAEPSAPTTKPVTQEAPGGPVETPEASTVRDEPSESTPVEVSGGPASADLCGSESPYGDNGTCGLAAGHKGLHRQLDESRAVVGSWPDR